MGHWLRVLLLTLVTLLLSTLVWASNSVWKVQTRHMKSLELNCGAGGRIVSLSVAGEVGRCRGLTADMFVQVNGCLWQQQCRLRKKRRDRYTVKLFRGDPATCITTKPKRYLVSYHCALANVKVTDLMTGTTAVVKERSGVIRSHEDHPWLYHVHVSGQRSVVTLVTPDPTAAALVYTILTLNLNNDVLTVWPGDSRDDVITYTHDVTNVTNSIEGAERVTFQLEMSPYSIGGEGFVLCFQWVTEEQNVRDACSGLVHPGQEPARRRKERNPGKRKAKKKRRQKNKERSKKTPTTAADTSP